MRKTGRMTNKEHPARFKNEVLEKELRRRGWSAAHFRNVLRHQGINPKIEEMIRGERQPSGGAAAVMSKVLEVPLDKLYQVTLRTPRRAAEKLVGAPKRALKPSARLDK